MYLKVVRKLLEELEEGDYPELCEKIPPLMHVVCLVWANCKYYCQPARLVVLFQEVCNLLVELSRAYLTDEVIKMEPEEGLEKVAEAKKLCKLFKECFEEKRKAIATYFKDSPPVEWEFQSDLIFQRFDRFVERVDTVEVSVCVCVSLYLYLFCNLMLLGIALKCFIHYFAYSYMCLCMVVCT